MDSIVFLLVEDHFNFRKGTSQTLQEHFPSCKCIHAANSMQALEYLKKQSIQLALVDLQYNTGDNGLDLIRDLHQHYPKTKSVVYTGFNSKEVLSQVKRSGATCYINKDADETTFINIIKYTLNQKGRTFFETTCYKNYFKKSEAINQRYFVGDFEKHITLTRREIEVLETIEKYPEYNNLQLAKRLFISPFTLKKHLSNLFKKLNVKGKHMAVITYRGHLLNGRIEKS